MSRLDTNRKELNLVPAQLCLINKTAQEETWDRLVQNYHYLGYKKMNGLRIKYLAMHSTGPLAALSLTRPP